MSRTPSSEVQHDWGRSVPNLGFSASSSSHNALAKSTTAVGSRDRPAYWYRTSRFVPRHLYGKGADAARAYQAQYSRRTSNSGDQRMSFGSQSQSPGSFVEQRRQTTEHPFGSRESRNMTKDNVAGRQYGYEEDEYEEEAIEDATMLDDGHGEYEDDEEDEEDEDEDEEEGDNEQPVTGLPYYTQQYEDEDDHEDYDEYTEEEEEDEQYAQPQAHQQPFAPSSSFGGPASQQLKQAGNTEDDAIELSD
jgi:nuclear mRNA export protein SAC3